MKRRWTEHGRRVFEKKLIVSELAEVSISPKLVVSYELGGKRDHVRIVIGLPKGMWNRSMPNLLICDHRRKTTRSIRRSFFAGSDHHRVTKQMEISEIMGFSARVTVIERKIDGRVIPFINLYDLKKEEEDKSLSCLFSTYFYRVEENGSVGIKYDAPLWYLSTRTFGPLNHQYAALYSLTSEERRIIIGDSKSHEATIIGGPIKTERRGYGHVTIPDGNDTDDTVDIENPMPYE